MGCGGSKNYTQAQLELITLSKIKPTFDKYARDSEAQKMMRKAYGNYKIGGNVFKGIGKT